MSNYNRSSGGLGTLILVNSTYNELNLSHSLPISIKIEGGIIFLFPSILLRTIGAGYTTFIVTHTVYLSRRKEVVSNQLAAVYVVSFIVCQEIERTVLREYLQKAACIRKMMKGTQMAGFLSHSRHFAFTVSFCLVTDDNS